VIGRFRQTGEPIGRELSVIADAPFDKTRALRHGYLPGGTVQSGV